MTFCIIAVIAIALLHVAGVIDTSRRFNKLETRISQLEKGN